MINLDEIDSGWLNPCGRHDFGVGSAGCACPEGDPRPVISSLVAEVERLRVAVEQCAEGYEQIDGGTEKVKVYAADVAAKIRAALGGKRATSGFSPRAQAAEPRCEHCGGELYRLVPREVVSMQACRSCNRLAAPGTPQVAGGRPVDLWLGPSRRDTVRLADLNLHDQGQA